MPILNPVQRVESTASPAPSQAAAESVSTAPLVEVGTRAKLIEAAMACFLEAGYQATSMEQVRQRAGVSNGSLYHHFATKQALADALYAQVLREFQAALMVPLAGNPPTTRARAQAAVRALVRAYLDWVVARPGQARLLADCRRDDRLAGASLQWQQANRDGFEALATFIQAGAAAGHLQDLPAEVWTALVLGPAIQLTPGWLARAQANSTGAANSATPGSVQIDATVRRTLQSAAWLAVAEPQTAMPDAPPKPPAPADDTQLPLFAPAGPPARLVAKTRRKPS